MDFHHALAAVCIRSAIVQRIWFGEDIRAEFARQPPIGQPSQYNHRQASNGSAEAMNIIVTDLEGTLTTGPSWRRVMIADIHRVAEARVWRVMPRTYRR